MNTASRVLISEGDRLSRKGPAIESAPTVMSVLLVSPLMDDHDRLEHILRPPQWSVYGVKTLKAATAFLQSNRTPLVLCEAQLGTRTWRDLWGEIALTVDPPLLIVTSRLADEHLWAEVLNLGAYDVLAKPLDQVELTRTLSSAWRNWRHRHFGAQPCEPMRAASAS